jgi:hypothetical protein
MIHEALIARGDDTRAGSRHRQLLTSTESVIGLARVLKKVW